MTEELRQEIVDAVAAADVCCPEQVCDVALDLAERGLDWRQSIRDAKDNDAAERRALGICTPQRFRD